MKKIILEVITFSAVNIYFSFALGYRNAGNEDSYPNIDALQLTRKSMEKIDPSRNSGLAFWIGLKKFLPDSIDSALLEMLSEAATDQCVADFNYTQESLLSSDEWAMKMLDSYGKPDTAIFLGNLKWVGQFDECVDVQAPPKKHTNVGGFQGKYCTLQVPLEIESESRAVSIGVCLPDTCYPSKTQFSLQRKFNLDGPFSYVGKSLEGAFTKLTLTCKSIPTKLTSGTIAFICIISFFALLALIGSSITALEYCGRSEFYEEVEVVPLIPKVKSAKRRVSRKDDDDDDRLQVAEEKAVFLGN